MGCLGTESPFSEAIAVSFHILPDRGYEVPVVDKARLWLITIRELLVFALISSVMTFSNGTFLSKTSDLQILRKGWGVLEPMPDRLDRVIDALGWLAISCKIRV